MTLSAAFHGDDCGDDDDDCGDDDDDCGDDDDDCGDDDNCGDDDDDDHRRKDPWQGSNAYWRMSYGLLKKNMGIKLLGNVDKKIC